MKIIACAFINRGMSLGYPFIERIRSALHLVDEYIIAIGECNDESRADRGSEVRCQRLEINISIEASQYRPELNPRAGAARSTAR
jgi:hypothetical protein